MEFEIMSGLSEFGFRVVRGLIKYFDFLSHIPYAKYAVLGFGSLIVYTKNHINPKSWKGIKIKS